MIQIGTHRVTLGSLVDPQLDNSLLRSDRVRVLYSDPPWGDGNLKYWQTMAQKMTGSTPDQITHDQMRDRILGLITRYVDGWVFIETGLRWRDYWGNALRSVGLAYVESHRIWYQSGSKLIENVLISACRATVSPARLGNVSDIRGAALAAHCVAALPVSPGDILLDPCCGMGYSARAAVGRGMTFRGNELNSKRLDKTIAFLRRAS